MKLNHDCVRSTLLFIEANHKPGIFLQLEQFLNSEELSKFDTDDIKYTLMKLSETKYLHDNIRIVQGKLVYYSTGALTWEGHKFLDTIRDPKVWKTTKTIVSHLESVSITLISNVASKVLENYIQNFLP
ncbi:DUF2513 domain-containing protein [Lactobacillus intestinalis]|uniref:DUF2513 domain-containing protein n=1 Tax=Lactobacillus intestinalis TaxID=151781 RepID=UPI0025A96DE3|nr:DUF2513 domain-containing protein [Lactobacillus intestinalis]